MGWTPFRPKAAPTTRSRTGSGRCEIAVNVRREAERYDAVAEMYRELAAAKDRGDYGDSAQTKSLRIAAEPGIRLSEALAAWARWARSRPSTSSASSVEEDAGVEEALGVEGVLDGAHRGDVGGGAVGG